jgi:glycosyltransferase involved in cell wall biosynthesis
VRKLIFVGRYERRKGVEELLPVIRKLKSDYDFEFDFVGNIPGRKRKQLEGIRYHGVVSDPIRLQELLRSCDVLVCPSHSEGMPNVIMEAMACGLAVIATDVGAVSEMVSSANGFLIAPGDPVKLEKALEAFLIMAPGDLNEMKKVSLAKVKESFLWDEIIALTIRRIKECCENP